MPDQDPDKRSLPELLRQLIGKAAASQVISVFLDFLRLGPFEKPLSNTLGRFVSATIGAFIPISIAIPIFLYMGAPAVFGAFIDWVRTVIISVNIAVVIFLVYFAVILAASCFVGFVVSNSTAETTTLSEMTFHGFKFTVALAVRLCVFLGILMFFKWLIAKLGTEGPWFWRS